MNEQKKQELEVSFKVDGHDVRLTPSIVQNYLVGSKASITLQEFKFFTELCKVRSLNPFLKEAYLIKYGDEPAQMVVGKDAISKRAVLHPQYNGMESGIIVTNEANETLDRQGGFRLPGERVVGGWARVYRKDWEYPTYCSVSLEECAQRKRDGNYNVFWHTKPATMIEKVAKSRALRETFVEILSGLYDAEEMGVELPTTNTIDITPENITINDAVEVGQADHGETASQDSISMDDI